MWVVEDSLWLLWPWWAVTVCWSVSWVRGSRGTLVGQRRRVDSNSDGGWRCYCGDGLAVRDRVGVMVWEVVIRLLIVGRAGSVACWVFSMAVRAMMAPSLSSSFKSVHARAGLGWGLPVQLALGVPAAVTLSSPGLGPRITTLRGDSLKKHNGIFILICKKKKKNHKRIIFLQFLHSSDVVCQFEMFRIHLCINQLIN